MSFFLPKKGQKCYHFWVKEVFSFFLNGLKNSPLTCDSIAAKSDSPADIHGMWYPTIRRTLMCLSKIYRSVEKAIFQEVSETYFYFSVYFSGYLFLEFGIIFYSFIVIYSSINI